MFWGRMWPRGCLDINPRDGLEPPDRGPNVPVQGRDGPGYPPASEDSGPGPEREQQL